MAGLGQDILGRGLGKQTALMVDNLGFHYAAREDTSGDSPDAQAIEHISFSARAGQCVLLCGPSGSGKSTVLKAVNGLVPELEAGHFEGKVEVGGVDLSTLPLYARSLMVASVFQNPKTQFFNTDVESEIVYALENRGTPVEEIETRLERTIADLRLYSLRGRSMFALSGGQKQLVAFASAYISDAPVVVLDEPSANLDAQATEKIAEVIGRMKDQGKTILIAEHRIHYLEGLVNEAIVMEKGRMEARLTGEELFSLLEERRLALGLRTLHKDVKQLRFSAADKPTDCKASTQNDSTDCTTPPPSTPPKPALSMRGVALAYGRQQVADKIGFDLFCGELVALTGRNGAGKTTLLRVIAGLAKPAQGTILVEGIEASQKIRRNVCGMVMQDVNHQLFSDSVLGECLLGNPHVNAEEARASLNVLGLGELEDRHPLSLSGGQKQRLALCVALLSGKKLLLLDEPTSGLDLRSMIGVRDALALLAKRGTSILVATHDQEFIDSVCTRTVHIG